jgi:hypothetical protein
MFGGKFKLNPPSLDPVFIDAVQAAMRDVEAKFPGKTGSAKREWVREQVDSKACGRMALVAATAADARDVIVEGQSGILATSPPNNRPE